MPRSSASLSEPAYQYLLDAILNGEMSPGDRISEAAIAERFHISRTPVRDAMRRLANEGLIDEKKQVQDHLDIADALMAQDKPRALECITDNLMSFYDLYRAFPIELY